MHCEINITGTRSVLLLHLGSIKYMEYSTSSFKISFIIDQFHLHLSNDMPLEL